jgi:hypothetical protein
MSDIVARLRDKHCCDNGCHCDEAADEIERLRAALEDVLSHTSYGDIPVTIYDNARAALAQEAPCSSS